MKFDEKNKKNIIDNFDAWGTFFPSSHTKLS